MKQKINNNYLLHWLEELQAKGKIVFTLAQAKQHFHEVKDAALISVLKRVVQRKKAVSVHNGFYIILSPEYSAKGIIPPLLFIDSLMKYLKKTYYVGLLSAAALHGASHQRSQEFFVVNKLPQLRPTLKNGIKINYLGKLEIPENLLEQRKTEAGYINVSGVELTVVDLVHYEKNIGGINRAAAIINELADAIKIKKITKQFVSCFPTAVLQRLGYILDIVLKKKQIADRLYNVLIKKDGLLQRVALKAGKKETGFITDKKWKVIINVEIEIDE